VIAGYTGPLLVGAVCLSLLHPARASATSASFAVALEYEPAPQCPGAEDLKAAVVARLGYDPFDDEAPHHVSLRIVRRASSLDGRIEWRDAERKWAGDQAFSMGSGDCLRLTRTMGLALAVQIQLLRDPSAAPVGDRELEVDRAPAKDTAEAPLVKPAGEAPAPTRALASTVVTTTPTASADTQRGVAVGAGPAVGFGLGPHPILLGRIFGQLTWQRTSLQLAAEVSLPSTARRPDGAGVSQQLLLLSAAGCEALERWSACLVLNLGRVSMAGQDIDRPTSTNLPFAAAGLRAGFTQALGARAFISPRMDGLVVLTRWTASLDDVPVWTLPRFAAAVGIDMGLRFR